MTTRMKKWISFSAWSALLAVLVTPTAMAWRWQGENTVTLPDYGVKIDRPDDRWRVLEPAYPALVEMRFLSAGQNAVLTLKDLPNLQSKTWRSSGTPNEEIKRLAAPYEATGWSFYETKRNGNDIDAEATDSSRRILMLKFIRKAASRRDRGFFAVEMTFPRELYPEAKPAFDRAASSVSETAP